MKLLVADRFETHALEELRHLGVEVVYDPECTAETLPRKLAGVGILIVGQTEVRAAAIEAGRSLHLIVKAGAGTAGIDLLTASARGIYVANCAGKEAVAVAELVMGLVCALDRRIPEAVIGLRDGRWERGELAKADGLHGRTLGLVGFGAVGREVAARGRAFGMHVVALSRTLTPQKAGDHHVGFARSLEELASRSHVLSLHVPLTDRTRGIISKSILAALPERAILINTARPELVDQEALLDAVANRGLRVGLDVFAGEPGEPSAAFESPLFKAVRSAGGLVYGTPHIGASTAQAEHAIAAETVRIVRSFVQTGEVPSCVNVSAISPARYLMVVRSLDKVGVLANVLGVVKRHGLNIEEVSSTIFDGAIAACTKFRVTGRPGEACIAEIKAFEEVFHVDVVALPNRA
jgi:D-3-phosphoglycerate dehydrogenase